MKRCASEGCVRADTELVVDVVPEQVDAIAGKAVGDVELNGAGAAGRRSAASGGAGGKTDPAAAGADLKRVGGGVEADGAVDGGGAGGAAGTDLDQRGGRSGGRKVSGADRHVTDERAGGNAGGGEARGFGAVGRDAHDVGADAVEAQVGVVVEVKRGGGRITVGKDNVGGRHRTAGGIQRRLRAGDATHADVAGRADRHARRTAHQPIEHVARAGEAEVFGAIEHQRGSAAVVVEVGVAVEAVVGGGGDGARNL